MMLPYNKLVFGKTHYNHPHKVKPTTEWEEKVVFLYKKYEEFKSKQEMFDFDDMLTGCYELFLHDPELTPTLSKSF